MMRWRPAFGAWPEHGGTRFAVWADANRVDLAIEQPEGATETRPLAPIGDSMFGGWFADLGPGARYRYAADGRPPVPDPASRFQPDGVHGASLVIDPTTFPWTDQGWRGLPRTDQVVYELHIGTFSPEGTFEGARRQLHRLAELGVTTIELMPVADFPGNRNWGYDGVALYAPARCYGTPDDLRRLVDEAHRLGLAVLLDVVYNHFGPDGAYIAQLTSRIFSSRHRSPWGAGLNLDGDGSHLVRGFFIDNACHWLHEYHMDGLRLDATHALNDDSPQHFLAELASRVRQGIGRPITLVAEDHRNLRTLLLPLDQDGYGLDAVWADDFHHEVRRLVIGDTEGYYADYAGTTADLVTILRQGWLYTGQESQHLRAPRGTPPEGLSAEQFVVFLQNHDQIGNRAFGERFHHQVDAATWRSTSALLLTAPQTPLLFMGQEWAASTPFLFFTDHEEELGRLVTEGRRQEFHHFSSFSDPEARARIPDPQAVSTFEASKLRWEERAEEPHAATVRLYAALLALRRSHPAFRQTPSRRVEARALDADTVLVDLAAETGERALIVSRLRGAGEVAVPDIGNVAFSAEPRGPGEPTGWAVLLTTEDEPFTADPAPPVFASDPAGMHVRFARPGTVVLVRNAVTSPRPRRLPLATYRLQLNHRFTFRHATDIVEYLHRLGITEAYTSPYLQSRPGSMHGYDLCDPSRLNTEIGTPEDHAAFIAALRARGMGHVLDVVPNHMSVDADANPWWRNVLENGPSSPSADFFDIDWAPVKPELHGKVLLPILGDQYGAVLERGELRLTFRDGALVLGYGRQHLPVNPRETARVFRPGLDRLREELGEGDPSLRELLSIFTALANLPAHTERSPERVEERQREKEVARQRFERLVADAPPVAMFVARMVDAANGTPGDPRSFDALHELLEAQAYRLAYWRTAFDEINYRRFFDVNELAGLRMEEPRVFLETHALILQLAREGAIDGLRIDHPDGLFDPPAYFERLQQASSRAPGDPPLWVVVEKILSTREDLPQSWPVHGTTGYDFLNDVNGVLIDKTAERMLVRAYERFTGRTYRPDAEIADCKREVMRRSMASELNVLGHALNVISEQDRRTRDFTLNTIRRALMEVVAAFPVYRTYVRATGATAADRAVVDVAVDTARRRNPTADESLFRFIRGALLGEWAAEDRPASPETERRLLAFAMKFQQYTGPVQAKGLEDTAFYRQAMLLSVNEVGGEPERFGRTVEEFHAANRLRQERWPYGMLCTATHDTKRGEDARARITSISEIPDLWRHAVASWRRVNSQHRSAVGGRLAPDRNEEYFFYQAILGAWPAEPPDAPIPAIAPAELLERVQTYMLKAVREAKINSSWLNEDEAYERAVTLFVERTLGPAGTRFLASFVPFARNIARLGAVNSLAQLLLKITAPGVPDFYQGTELWDLSFVDPDNRRPVDFPERRVILDSLEPLLAAAEACDGGTASAAQRDALRQGLGDLLRQWYDGRIKAYLTARGLRLRREHSALLLEGRYVPLTTDEEGVQHLVGFARVLDGRVLVTMAPRLSGRLIPPGDAFPLGAMAWKTIRVFVPDELSAPAWRNVLTGERVPLVHGEDRRFLLAAHAFATLPVAWLVPDRGSSDG